MTNILNLADMPDDPIEQLLWLSGINDAVKRELTDAYSSAYANARLEGRLDSALSLGLHGKATILALTRRWNNARGRSVRWGDRLDRYSSAYSGE